MGLAANQDVRELGRHGFHNNCNINILSCPAYLIIFFTKKVKQSCLLNNLLQENVYIIS